MSTYTEEIEYDDFVDGCWCCDMNLDILEGEGDD
jgi:hypothetical protein